MYIQITTRCNMSCDHCCFSCTSTGEDMSFKIFKKAVKYDDAVVFIGGGEPTMHPNFDKILFHAITNANSVWLATNGKKTNIALMLSKLAHKGIISCDLSLDDYHETIDPEVIEAFKRSEEKDDLRRVRDVTGREKNVGRCDFGTDGCPCEDIIIKPNGDIKQCGCSDSPIMGNIMSVSCLDLGNCEVGCYKDLHE